MAFENPSGYGLPAQKSEHLVLDSDTAVVQSFCLFGSIRQDSLERVGQRNVRAGELWSEHRRCFLDFAAKSSTSVLSFRNPAMMSLSSRADQGGNVRAR